MCTSTTVRLIDHPSVSQAPRATWWDYFLLGLVTLQLVCHKLFSLQLSQVQKNPTQHYESLILRS